MRYLKTTIRNLGPFAETTVDIAALPGPLVAVCGANGAGKSTFLELLLGAVWRTMPTRGSLIDLATSRDASVEVAFEHDGRRYTIRQVVDGVGRKGEAVITDGDGTPLVDSTKVSEVAAYVAAHLPPLDVILTSAFIAQQSQGFLDAKPAERKALLLRMLGVEKLEALAVEARGRAQEEARSYAVADQRVKDEAARTGGVDRARAVLDEARVELARAKEEEGAADNAAEASAEAERARDARAKERAEAEASARAAALALTAADKRVADLRTRIGNNREIIGKADAIRAAEVELATASAEYEEARQRFAALTERVAGAAAAARARDARATELAEHRAKASRAAGERKAVEEAAAEAARLSAAVETAEAAAAVEAAAVEEARAKASGDRIGHLRQGLASIRDSHTDIDAARETAAVTLTADDEAKAAPAEAAERAERAESMQRRARDLRTQLRIREGLAATAPIVEAAERELEEVRAAEAALAAEVETDRAAAAEQERELEAVTERTEAGFRRLGELRPVAALAPKLAAAEARIAELEPQLAAAEAALSDALTEQAAIVVPEPLPAVDLAGARARLARAKAALGDAAKAESRAEVAFQLAEGSAAEHALREAERDAIAVHLGDWQRLAKDLGKDGLQAAVIDAALPELVAMSNSLLHRAFGPRFTLDVRSQSLDSKGKRLLETLDVVVIDSEHGRESLAETYSGGERAIIAEGLSLALTALAARENGLVRPTLVRDEAGAALDARNGRAWIAMLREACSMMGADRLLFVSHSAELSDLADSRIEL